jgi:hypothetical protein
MNALVAIALMACTVPADDAVTGTDEALGLARTVALPVTVAELDGPARLEVRAVRDGVASHRTLATAAVQSEQLTVALPTIAPVRDRDRADPSAPVVYRVAMRTDDAGLPGPYTGVADAALTYFYAAPDAQRYAGATRGWNVAYDIDGDAPRYEPLANGVGLRPNLVGDDSVALSGTADVPWSPSTRVAVQARVGDALFTVADTPSTRDWSVTMDLLPPEAALFEAAGLRGAYMQIVAYDDVDGSGSPSEVEPPLGAACFDGREVVLAYFEPPATFEGAVALADYGGVAGFAPVQFGEARMERIDDLHTDDLLITDACGEAPSQDEP